MLEKREKLLKFNFYVVGLHEVNAPLECFLPDLLQRSGRQIWKTRVINVGKKGKIIEI